MFTPAPRGADYQVMLDGTEVGAAWKKTVRASRKAHLSAKLDQVFLAAPINSALTAQEDDSCRRRSLPRDTPWSSNGQLSPVWCWCDSVPEQRRVLSSPPFTTRPGSPTWSSGQACSTGSAGLSSLPGCSVVVVTCSAKATSFMW